MNGELIMPTITCLEEEGSGATYAIEPLPAGYGIVLGNPLRRVLLSSLPGAAITAIKINGVAHEFQDIPHVLEDVTEIVLNIKRIRLRSFADLPASLFLQVRGTPQGREVTAADIQAPAAIEIVNPAQQHIATLDNEQVTLTMELIAETGRGYRLAPVDPKQAVIGTIDLDALFSPIVHVNITVEPLSQGKQQHHASFPAQERLLLKIVTDGTITPDEALRQAADILVQHYELFTTPLPADSAADDSASAKQIFIPPELYQLKIDALPLPRRLQNALRRHVSTVGQLLEMEENELHSIRNFGAKGLQQLSEVLLKEKMIPILSSPDASSHDEADQPDKTQGQEEDMQAQTEPEKQEQRPLKENAQ